MPKNDDKRNAHPVERRNETTVQQTVCSLSSLLIAEKRCRRNVGYKNSVAKFSMYTLSKCYELHRDLMNGKYRTEYGTEFDIYEPKHRVVTSTRYRDRIPQASFVMNYYYAVVVPNLVDENYACMKGRGVDVARNKLKQFLREATPTDYILKADMKSYFASIDHEKLVKEMSEYITDEWALWYYKDVVYCNKKGEGLGLGSEINQLSAASFPNKLDHKLKALRYSDERYMDDFVFVGTKEESELALQFIYEEADRLKLTVSKNKTYIQPVSKPVKFLGFTFLRHETGRVTMKRIKQKRNNERRRLRRMKRKGVPFERVKEHFNSVMAVMKKGNRSGYLKMWKYFNELFKEEIENELNQKRKCSAGNAGEESNSNGTANCRAD